MHVTTNKDITLPWVHKGTIYRISRMGPIPRLELSTVWLQTVKIFSLLHSVCLQKCMAIILIIYNMQVLMIKSIIVFCYQLSYNNSPSGPVAWQKKYTYNMYVSNGPMLRKVGFYWQFTNRKLIITNRTHDNQRISCRGNGIQIA